MMVCVPMAVAAHTGLRNARSGVLAGAVAGLVHVIKDVTRMWVAGAGEGVGGAQRQADAASGLRGDEACGYDGAGCADQRLPAGQV